MADLDDGDDLTVRGEIEASSVPELVRSLLGSGETGVLTFRREELKKSLYVQNGQIVYASSSNPDERLGENLLLRGKISVRQYIEASKRIQSGRRLGALLVELGAIEPDELIPAVEHHARQILMDLFTWTHGSYEFAIRELDGQSLVTLNLATENLILEGIRNCRSWSQVFRGIGSLEAIPVPTGNTDTVYKLDLGAEEQEILAQVNGRASIEQICEVSYLSHFETCRILWALQVLGVIRWGLAGEADTAGEVAREIQKELDLEEIVEKFNQMFGRIYTFLRGRLAGSVDEFMDAALEQVSLQYGTLFAGVDLKDYGRADYDQMLANVADLPADQRKRLMVAGLNELVFVIQLAVRTRFSGQEEAVVSGIIKEGVRRLGVA